MNKRKVDKPWSDEDIAILKAEWPTTSASIIGKKLGRSRNAIIGKAHRLFSSAKPMTQNLAELSRANHTPAKSRQRDSLGHFVLGGPASAKLPPQPIPVAPEAAPNEGIPLLEAGAGQCRAIIGSTDDRHHLAKVCGKPTVESRSFCQQHMDEYTYTLTTSRRSF